MPKNKIQEKAVANNEMDMPQSKSPYNGFTPGTLVFTHFTTTRQRYSPAEWFLLNNDNIIKRCN